MAVNYLKDLFEYLKQLGLYSQYKDYNDYRRKVHGVDTTSEERHEKHNNWKSSLSEKDQQDFNYMFED